MNSVSQLPEQYGELCKIDMNKNKKVAITVNVAAILIAVITVMIGNKIVPMYKMFEGTMKASELLIKLMCVVGGLLIYLVLHELTHGIFMKRFSSEKVHYGYKGLYAYAGSDAYFCKKHYIIIALAPVVIGCVVLNTLCALVPQSWFWTAFIIQTCNIAGAAGDIYVTVKFLSMPKDILIQDTGVEMTVYVKKQVTD